MCFPLFIAFDPFRDCRREDEPSDAAIEGSRLSGGMDIFGVGAARRPRAGVGGVGALGAGVVRRDDDLSDAAMDGRRLSDGIDVFGVGALRRGRTGAAVDVDFFVLGVAYFCILCGLVRRMALVWLLDAVDGDALDANVEGRRPLA